MPKWVDCPFYKYDLHNHIICEDSKVKFKSRVELRHHMKKYCGDVKEYKNCQVAMKLEQEWEGSMNPELMKELEAYRHRDSARERQIMELKNRIHIRDAKLEASEMYIKALMMRLKTKTVIIKNSELVKAHKTKMNCIMNENDYRFELVED